MPKQQEDMTNLELMEHLSEVTEQYGIKFEYEVADNETTITGLRMFAKKDPEANLAVDVMLLLIAMLSEMAFMTVSELNSEHSYALRCQQIQTVIDKIQEIVGQRYVSAIDDAKTHIDLVH